MSKKIFIASLLLIAALVIPSRALHAADDRRTCITYDPDHPTSTVPVLRYDCTQRLIAPGESCRAGEASMTMDQARAFCNVTNVTGTSTPASTNRTPTLNEIAPRLQIPIAPNFQFSKILVQDVDEGNETQTYGYIPYIAEYFAMVYKYLIGIAGLVAGIVITLAGFEWLLARGDAGKIKHAKERINGAVLGLVLALGSYTVLYFINPDLVTFKNIKVKLVQEEALTVDDSPDELEDSVNPIDQRIALSSGAGCNKGGILSSAESLVNVPTCVGPNHCVWFVNRVLNTAGCNVNQTNVAHGPTLKRALLQIGWQQNTGDLKSNLDKMKNIAVIRRNAHYALVVRTGTGNSPNDFTCYESNYTRPAQKLMRQYGGANCTTSSKGTECRKCERFDFEGPSPDTSGGYWARKYTRRYGANGPNQAFIKGPGLCGTSDEFFVLPE